MYTWWKSWRASLVAAALTALAAVAVMAAGGGAEFFDDTPAPAPALVLEPALAAVAAALPAPADTAAPVGGARQVLAVPAVPKWAKFGKQRAGPAKEHETNKKEVARANRANQRLDFVMFGDSITAFHMADPSVWTRHFGDVQALPLAMGGSTTNELAWRVMVGGEKLSVDPKVVAILVGINDLKWAKQDPAPNMDEMLRWMRAVWPTTKFAVMALLPNVHLDTRPTSRKYRELAKRQGVLYVDCGKGMNAANKGEFKDGTHPTAAGQDAILKCLRAAVQPYLK